jgi:hypothetical protein
MTTLIFLDIFRAKEPPSQATTSHHSEPELAQRNAPLNTKVKPNSRATWF